MNKMMTLRLPQRNKMAVYMQILLVMIMLWLRDVLHFPAGITYLTDVFLLYLLFICLYGKTNVRIWKDIFPQYIIFGLIVLCMFLGVVINFVNPLLVLWGMRNNLRFFLFFFVCIKVLDTHDVDSIINLIKGFFWINVAMCMVQYFFFDLSGDQLGGLFGVVAGCNAYMNILLCMVSAIVLGQYFIKIMKIRTLIIYIFFCIYIAVLSELKVFYLEIAIMVVLTLLCSQSIRKKLGVVLLSIAIIGAGVILLLRYDARWLEFFSNSTAMEEYLAGSGYTASNDLNRLTAIQELYSRFFEGQPIKSLFGFGLGNCETANYSFLHSDFFNRYGHLHYRWFTHAWVYLEQGALGLILLIVFFVSLVIYTVKKRDAERKDLIFASILFLPICFLAIIYNSALQIEVCYLIAFMCSIPHVLSKNKLIKKEETKQ